MENRGGRRGTEPWKAYKGAPGQKAAAFGRCRAPCRAQWRAPRGRGGSTAGARSGGPAEDGRIPSTRGRQHPAHQFWPKLATARGTRLAFLT